MDYTRQTRYSDPGRHAELFDALPGDVAGIGAVVRNVTVHYRASGLDFPPDRLAEIDSRWVARILEVDQARGDRPLARPRDAAGERVVGCCRDAALLTVSVLRAKGVPARTRVGFADYLEPDYHVDHVVTEFHDGRRWVAADTQIGLDDVVLGPGGLRTAAQVWTAYRRGELDPETCGVGRNVGLGGAAMIRRYVLFEAAHRYGDELLLWDFWGDPAPEVADEVAALLLAADAGEPGAEEALARRYACDPRLHPGDAVLTVSPTGKYPVETRLSVHEKRGRSRRAPGAVSPAGRSVHEEGDQAVQFGVRIGG